MDALDDYIEIPIDIELHETFVSVIKNFNVHYKIENGMYKLYYTNPTNLFQIGLQIGRIGHNNNFYTTYGFPKK